MFSTQKQRRVGKMNDSTHKQFPQLVGDVAEVLSAPADASGSIWKLEPHTRGLDCNVIAINLENGSMVWLPKLSVRRFVAGEKGLRYFSVHTRKRGLQIGRPPAHD